VSDSLIDTDPDPDLTLLYSYGCAVALDLDHGVARRTALDRYVEFVLSAFDVDRVRIRALATRARAKVPEQGDHAWREAALLGETALAMLGDESVDTSTGQ
jgi:hypothetical protein